ncbi:hypothetical protein ACYSNV_05940 [Myroides sp. LJL119]
MQRKNLSNQKVYTYVKSWNLLRFLRFLIALSALLQGVESKDVFLIIAGLVFMIFTLFKKQCCLNSCSLNQ